ncbi:GrpB family protein [Algisphaera agarilytica]|uniref:GrpB-like predicted nucleotidyltransferase (UPF0157 family) n=1 Tax=Algisphaera agarilytica TaxID=1385975 RepID=A0A7X0LL56_9BACT|nr:GrpB family protein [Algisphaera agarilytica]MBB6431160.1 GrpB-like predicted nucleotidyltransferase (UPF0157 family) [Algisphaera agarilytica]
MSRIEVVPYDPDWPSVFQRLHDSMWPALAPHALRIEHVGSTSVPGLAAKPIIDMTIVVPSVDELERVIEALAGLGYEHRGDLGVVGREAFRSPEGLPVHHLYACIEGALALRNHVAVRDHLRAHPEAARQYGELKLALAEEHPNDIDAYVAGKTQMLLWILDAAGLDERERKEIASINGGAA